MSESPRFDTREAALEHAERRSAQQLADARALDHIEDHRPDVIPDDGVRFSLPLSPLETQVLAMGIGLWTASAAQLDDRRARLIGFADAADYRDRAPDIVARIKDGQPLAVEDWRRALRSTEMLFVSWEDGLAYEWSMFSNVSDEATILVLRALQTKIRVWLPSPDNERP
jgi:hypothetical protein